MMEKRAHKKISKRIVSVMLATTLLVSGVFIPVREARADQSMPDITNALNAKKNQKTIKLSTCRSLALENSDVRDSAQDKVYSTEAKRDSSIKALKLKKKHLTTFSWSPLLNFHFPEKLTEAQKSDFEYKPRQLQSDVDVAQHNLQDKTFEVNEKTNALYVEIVSLQENIAFNESRLLSLEDGLARNKAKLKTGDANQADVDKLEKKVQSTTEKIAADRRTLEADLKKLSKMINLDVTTGYNFEKPYVEAKIDRESLDTLITYTEDRDETYYEACANATTAKLQLSINYDLMKSYYGKDIKIIQDYVNQALNDQEISKKAFKKAYKDFLKQIDSYWEGEYKIKIIFFTIKFPKLYLKGSLDGSRWIEDDPNILEENVLDYISAHNDEVAAREELDQSVTDTFNNYVSIKNSYEKSLKDVDEMGKDLEQYAIKNKMGEMTFEEYSDAQDQYEELQNSMHDTMKLYTDTLYSFDRLTCGGISALLEGTDADMHTAVVGESYVDKNSSKVQYYLKPIIQREMFSLSIFVPDGFTGEITDFEFWCDNEMIGERTPKDKELRHLMLTTENVEKTFIRFYNGEEFVDDCEFDSSQEQGYLDVTTGVDVKKNEGGEIGTYLVEVSSVTGLTSVTLKPNETEQVASFRILTKDGTPLGDGNKIKIDKKFTHLGLVSTDLAELEIEFYDEGDSLKYKGRFDTANKKLLKKEDLTQ